MEIKNKKASFDYTFIDEDIAGIVLKGTEIKSIRDGKASLVDSFCYFKDGELYLKNSYVALYDKNGYKNHEERADRKLLLTKQELAKLNAKVKMKGYSIIPYKMFINERGLCKLSIYLATGKKSYNKRAAIKERDIDRQAKKEI